MSLRMSLNSAVWWRVAQLMNEHSISQAVSYLNLQDRQFIPSSHQKYNNIVSSHPNLPSCLIQQLIVMNKPSLCILTSNAGKIEEFQYLLGSSFSLTFHNIDLPEIQGEPETIAKVKAEYAFKKMQKPILVDDGSLCFNAYHGLPGPYIKWFLNKMELTDIAKMVEPFVDKSGHALCILAIMDDQLKEPILFTGRVEGMIVPPRGSPGYGWYSIFQPSGLEQTLAELPEEQRNRNTHRYYACQQLINHLGEPGQKQQ